MGRLFTFIRTNAGLENLESLKTEQSAPGRSAGQVIAKAAAIDKRVRARQTDELIGICRGVLADGALVDSEIGFLADWMQLNLECSDAWPYTVLYDRITAAISDGVISEEEEKELLGLLHHVTSGMGGKLSDGEATGQPTEGLPYDVPAPRVMFPDHAFCVTGEFAFGPRKKVHGAIEERGGRIVGAPSSKTNFLIVGITGSAAWKHSTHGTKIIKAIELKEAGESIAIISEEHWTKHL